MLLNVNGVDVTWKHSHIHTLWKHSRIHTLQQTLTYSPVQYTPRHGRRDKDLEQTDSSADVVHSYIHTLQPNTHFLTFRNTNTNTAGTVVATKIWSRLTV
jgi:hypothetical protein